MHRPDQVAWLALMYRSCERAHHTAFLSHLDDLDSFPGEISLATLEAARVFTDADWALVGNLIDHPENVLATSAELTLRDDSLRAEALLHAVDQETRNAWAGFYRGSRWREVEHAMQQLETAGLAANRDDVEEVAVAAYKMLTGRTHEEYMDEFAVFLFPEYGVDV